MCRSVHSARHSAAAFLSNDQVKTETVKPSSARSERHSFSTPASTMNALVLLLVCLVASAVAFAPAGVGAALRAGAIHMKLAMGDVAPDFALTNKDGKTFKVAART